ncbi:uncharacterized protein LOC113351823 [Papaver somniferum]|uniref:uncharacterized protein LOC113351823 n=1 Tax=Papaver somniferum TaxID=3469 RepID=UPI000E6F8E50|nr:uncharacterized protein LOC113351823 [Papaver somniferum]
MDFISGLPKSEGREVILVVVDRYTKYSHFLALNHPYTSATVAKCLLTRLGTSLHLSTAYHPQTNGQTERVNACLESYLRFMINDNLQQRQVVGHMLKGVLEEAQHRIKQQADKKRIEREFKEGEWVYLRLQSYMHTSVQLRKNLKLAAKFFGPYKILERIGKVAYKLQLPPESKIHLHFMSLS